jgi:prevent-host-death family protein
MGRPRTDAPSPETCRRRRTRATLISVPKVITQRTLRNDSGAIMRGLDRGESYIVTRNGLPVGELVPVRRREAVPVGLLLAALVGAPRIDPSRFRKDLDELIDQDPRPHA